MCQEASRSAPSSASECAASTVRTVVGAADAGSTAPGAATGSPGRPTGSGRGPPETVIRTRGPGPGGIRGAGRGGTPGGGGRWHSEAGARRRSGAGARRHSGAGARRHSWGGARRRSGGGARRLVVLAFPYPAVPYLVHRRRLARQAPRVVVHEDDRRARRETPADRRVEFRPRARVQAGPRLVEDEQRRLGEKGLGGRDLLAGALRELRHGRTGVLPRPEALQPLLGPRPRRRPAEAPDPPEVDQIVGGRERQGHREALGDVRRARRAPGDTALGGRVHAGDEPQQGRLAGAVRADDPDEGPGGQIETDLPEDPPPPQAVPAADPLQPQLDEVFCGVSSLGRTTTKPWPSIFSCTASPEPPRSIDPRDCERCSEVCSCSLQPTTASVST